MKRWLRALLVVVGLTASAAFMIWLMRPWLEREIARRVEADLSVATGMPAAVSSLQIGLLPPRLSFDRLALGSQDSMALEVVGLVAELDPLAWAATVHIDKTAADFDKWVLSPSAARRGPALPAWLPSLVLAVGVVDARGAVAAEPWRLQAAPLNLHLVRSLERLSAGVDVGDVRLQRAEETTHFEQFAAEADLHGSAFLIRWARIVGDLGSVVAGTERDGPATEAAPLEAHVALDRLARFLGVPERIGGSLTWSGEIRLPATGVGAVEDLRLSGKLEVGAPVYEDFTARGLKAVVSLEDARLQIRSLEVELERGQIAGAADVGLAPPHKISLELTGEAQDPTAMAPWIENRLASGPVTVRLGGAGELSPLSVAGSLAVKLSAVRRVSPDNPTVKSTAAPPTLDANLDVDFRRVERGTEAQGSLHLVASDRPSSADAGTIDLVLRLAGDGALSGTIGVRVADARRLQPLAPAVTAGRIDGSVKLAGRSDAPLVDGSLLAQDLVLAGTRFERIGGAFEAGSDFLVAKPLELQTLGGVARLQGRLGLTPQARNDWRASLAHVDLAAVWIALDSVGVTLPYLTGVLDGDASASGAWEDVDLTARLVSGAIKVGTERFDSVALQAQAKAQKWTLDAELIRRPDEILRVVGGGTDTSRAWFSSWSTPWRVDGFRFLSEYPSRRGSAVFSADFYGPLVALQGKAQLTVSDLGIGARDLGTFTGEVDSLPKGEYRLFVGDTEERLLVRGSVRGEAGRPFSIGADLHHFDLADVLAPDQAATLVADGSLHLEGRVVDVGRSLSGELTLTQFEIVREELSMRAVAPIVARARNGRVEISSFDLRGDFGSLDVRGGIGFDGAVALDVRAEADVRLAEAIPKSPVRWASGSASLDAYIRREAGRAPELEGHGSLQRLSIDLGLPFLMTDANGAFVLQGSRIILGEVRGGAGGGTFVLSGYVDTAEGPHLQWEAEDVNSGFLDWLQDEVSGKGEIRGTWDATEIAGDIQVNSALYDRNVELKDLLPIFRRNLGPTPPKPGEKAILLDLHIRAPDSVFIDNNIAKAEFRADLNIGGSDLAPRLRGEVELLDGQATLFDRRFELTLGRVNFVEGTKINPRLEFSANTDISTADGDYNVVAEVTGTLDDPRVRLTADDRTLTTTDVAALLTMGKTMTQIQSEGGGASIGDLSALAPVLYGSQVERGVKSFLPIDRFTLEPGFSRTTGDFEPKVTVGADLARHLRGTLSTTVGVQTQNAVQLEYQLTPSMLVVGSWTSRTETPAGGFGGALKYRYRFRYLPRYTLLPANWWSAD